MMFGFSVYLNKDLSSENKAYINNMKQGGFQGVFTSIQIPEIIKQSTSNGYKLWQVFVGT